MARLFLGLLAILATLGAARADLILNEMQGFSVVSGGATSVTFLNCTSDTSNTDSYSFGGQATGTASADRYTIIGVVGEDAASNFAVSSVTVGGASATEIADEDGTGLVNSAIYIVANPDGTSETVEVGWSEPVTGTAICLWQANNLADATAFSTAVDDDTASGNLALSINTVALKISVGVCGVEASGNTTTWTGLTERDDNDAGAEFGYSAADFTEDATASTPLSVDCNYTGTGDSTGATATFD